MDKVEFLYLGKITVNKRHYEVFEDETNNLINLFHKNSNIKDVECWSIKKKHLDNVNGKSLLDKTQKHWSKVIMLNERMLNFLDIKPFIQTFPIDFWNGVIVPLKNGEKMDLEISTVK